MAIQKSGNIENTTKEFKVVLIIDPHFSEIRTGLSDLILIGKDEAFLFRNLPSFFGPRLQKIDYEMAKGLVNDDVNYKREYVTNYLSEKRYILRPFHYTNVRRDDINQKVKGLKILSANITETQYFRIKSEAYGFDNEKKEFNIIRNNCITAAQKVLIGGLTDKEYKIAKSYRNLLHMDSRIPTSVISYFKNIFLLLERQGIKQQEINKVNALQEIMDRVLISKNNGTYAKEDEEIDKFRVISLASTGAKLESNKIFMNMCNFLGWDDVWKETGKDMMRLNNGTSYVNVDPDIHLPAKLKTAAPWIAGSLVQNIKHRIWEEPQSQMETVSNDIIIGKGQGSKFSITNLKSNERKIDIEFETIGHATVGIKITHPDDKESYNVLTDVILTDSTPYPQGPQKRYIPLDANYRREICNRRIHTTLTSHNHKDHLDPNVYNPHLGRTDEDINYLKNVDNIFLPKGCSSYIERKGTNVRCFNWWDKIEVNHGKLHLTFTFVPGQHWSTPKKTKPFMFNKSRFGGWVIEAEDKVDKSIAKRMIYFSGDTGYCEKIFTEIKNYFCQGNNNDNKENSKFDTVLLQCNEYPNESFFTPQHMVTRQVVDAANILGADLLIPIHYNAFKLDSKSPKEVKSELLKNWITNPDRPVTQSIWMGEAGHKVSLNEVEMIRDEYVRTHSDSRNNSSNLLNANYDKMKRPVSKDREEGISM